MKISNEIYYNLRWNVPLLLVWPHLKKNSLHYFPSKPISIDSNDTKLKYWNVNFFLSKTDDISNHNIKKIRHSEKTQF